MDSLIDKYPDLDEITGQFVATKEIQGCKCYLGAAARKGFNFFALDSKKDVCKGKRELNPGNYDEICKDLIENKCGGVLGNITKN